MKTTKPAKGEKSEKPAPRKVAPRATRSASSASGDSVGKIVKHQKREMQGVVVGDKMQKTIVVQVERLVKHALYDKYIRRSRKFKAHDEQNTAKNGDLVLLIESRPLSRDKNWALKSILRKAGSAANVEISA